MFNWLTKNMVTDSGFELRTSVYSFGDILGQVHDQ